MYCLTHHLARQKQGFFFNKSGSLKPFKPGLTGLKLNGCAILNQISLGQTRLSQTSPFIWLLVLALGFMAESRADLAMPLALPQQISAANAFHQEQPAIAGRLDGYHGVAWQACQQASAASDCPAAEILLRLFSATGDPLSEIIRVNPGNGPAFSPDIAMNPAGDLVVTWQAGGVIYGRWFGSADNPNGAEPLMSDPFVLQSTNTPNNNPSRRGKIALDARGSLALIYENNGALRFRQYQASISTPPAFVASSEALTLASNLTNPQAALARSYLGHSMVVWQARANGWDIFKAELDAQGRLLPGSQRRVHEASELDQNQPDVAMDSAGNALISWQQGPDTGAIRARYFPYLGLPLAALDIQNRLINLTSKARLASAQPDLFAIVWQDQQVLLALGQSLFMQLYNAQTNALLLDQPASVREQTSDLDFADSYQQAAPAMAFSGTTTIAWQAKELATGEQFVIETNRYAGSGRRAELDIELSTPRPAYELDESFALNLQLTNQETQPVGALWLSIELDSALAFEPDNPQTNDFGPWLCQTGATANRQHCRLEMIQANAQSSLSLGLKTVALGTSTLSGQLSFSPSSGDANNIIDAQSLSLSISSDLPDADFDGIFDNQDNCIDIANPDQQDSDQDGQGNACDKDDDNDQWADDVDNCPLEPNPDQLNADIDDLGNACDNDDDNDLRNDSEDNCPLVFNPLQTDNNANGIGDACEQDQDGDLIEDDQDNCPSAFNPSQLDRDADGQGDSCDTDLDGDQIDNAIDNCPNDNNPSQLDADQDGLGAACDADETDPNGGGGPSLPPTNPAPSPEPEIEDESASPHEGGGASLSLGWLLILMVWAFIRRDIAYFKK